MSNGILPDHDLLNTKSSRPLHKRIRDHLAEELATAWSDGMLILHCFVTGLLDSAVFNVWSCFVSMQTGNTIYVGLGFSSQPASQPYRWAKSGTAILSFLLGAFLFARLMRHLGPLRRSTITLTTLLQSVLIFVSAALASSPLVPKDAGSLIPQNLIVLLPLALLSIQSGGQIFLSRVLGYGEVTSVVLTSAYCDLVIDEKVFKQGIRGNPKRNRRATSAVVMLAGAIAGGFLTMDGEIARALWLAGAVKLAFVVVWMGWQGEKGVRLE